MRGPRWWLKLAGTNGTRRVNADQSPGLELGPVVNGNYASRRLDEVGSGYHLAAGGGAVADGSGG